MRHSSPLSYLVLSILLLFAAEESFGQSDKRYRSWSSKRAKYGKTRHRYNEVGHQLYLGLRVGVQNSSFAFLQKPGGQKVGSYIDIASIAPGVDRTPYGGGFLEFLYSRNTFSFGVQLGLEYAMLGHTMTREQTFEYDPYQKPNLNVLITYFQAPLLLKGYAGSPSRRFSLGIGPILQYAHSGYFLGDSARYELSFDNSDQMSRWHLSLSVALGLRAAVGIGFLDITLGAMTSLVPFGPKAVFNAYQFVDAEVALVSYNLSVGYTIILFKRRDFRSR